MTVLDRLQGAASSMAFKAPCRMASTANIATLEGMQTVDGVLPTSSQHPDLRRVLLKDQDDATENGIWIMDDDEWERAKDFDGNNDFRQGTRVYVFAGSTQSGTYIVTSSMDPSTFDFDTDDITFAEVGTFDQTTSALGLSSGGVISWNSGDVTITHSADGLAFAGASSGYTFDAPGSFTSTDSSTQAVKAANSADSASVRVARFDGDRASPAINDTAFNSFFLSNGAGTQVEAIRQSWRLTSVTASSESAQAFWSIRSVGTLTDTLLLTPALLAPVTNDLLALGSSSVSWADLFLASGGVINFNGGDVTITHSSSALAFAGAGGGYSFDAAVTVSGLLTASSGLSVNSTFTSSGACLLVTGTTVTVGGVVAKGIFFGGTTNFGIYFGSSAPAIPAAQGSLYIRTDGGSSLTRAYIQSSGSSATWVGLLTTA